MSRITFTLRAWPVIAAATIALCFLTQAGAKLFGIELPDQQNIELVRRLARQALTSARAFGVFALVLAEVIVVMPVLEELIFRGLFFKLATKLKRRFLNGTSGTNGTTGTSGAGKMGRDALGFALLSSALFSAAHYLAQPWPDAAFLALFFFGFAQCWLYRRAERIWCAMVNHALFNTTNLALLFILPE